MRVQLLSSSLGFGHRRAAEAVAEALRDREPNVVIDHVDFWSLMDPQVAGAVKDGYLDAVTHYPTLYDQLYRYDTEQWREFFRHPEVPEVLEKVIRNALDTWFPQRGKFPARGANLDQTLFLNLVGGFEPGPVNQSNLVRRGLLIWLHSRLARRLRQRLYRFRPDVIVSSQMMPAAVLAAVRRRGEFVDTPAVAVLTDYGVHDFWLRSQMDRYCVATPSMAADLRAQGISERAITVTGIPLMRGFRRPPDVQAARVRLGLPRDEAVVLVTGGGYGIGCMDTVARVLDGGFNGHLLVANASEGGAKRDAAAPVSVRMYTGDIDMPTLVRAADIVIGKPGGLSVSEALACGRPFLAVHALGGQETFNVAYLQRHRVGDDSELAALPRQLQRWIGDPAALAAAQARAASLGVADASERVADVVLAQGRDSAAGDRSER